LEAVEEEALDQAQEADPETLAPVELLPTEDVQEEIDSDALALAEDELAAEGEELDEPTDELAAEGEELEEPTDEPVTEGEELEEPTDELATEGEELDEPADEPATEGEELEEPTDERAWYVIHCYSGYEHKVKQNLEQRIETMQMQDRIFQVVIPTEEEIEVKDGKRRTVERRVFPGYILVQMLMDDDSWYVVRNTPGVTGFVGMGNRPAPLRPEEVQSIMKRMEAEAPRIKVTFKPGQKVRIVDGPFNEFVGVVDDIDMERAKVRILVSFFGRDTPVELDFLQVEKT
jgi:transcriptional antiterminator NusG